MIGCGQDIKGVLSWYDILIWYASWYPAYQGPRIVLICSISRPYRPYCACCPIRLCAVQKVQKACASVRCQKGHGTRGRGIDFKGLMQNMPTCMKVYMYSYFFWTMVSRCSSSAALTIYCHVSVRETALPREGLSKQTWRGHRAPSPTVATLSIYIYTIYILCVGACSVCIHTSSLYNTERWAQCTWVYASAQIAHAYSPTISTRTHMGCAYAHMQGIYTNARHTHTCKAYKHASHKHTCKAHKHRTF